MKYKEIKYKVSSKGSVGIETAYIVEEGPNIVAIAVDLKNKYNSIVYIGSDADIPMVGLVTPKEAKTKYYNPTDILLMGYKGWVIWAANVNRYTLAVCLLREEDYN